MMPPMRMVGINGRFMWCAALVMLDAVLSAAAPAPGTNYWATEDSAARDKLPLYQTIPAATADELTATNHWPPAGEYANWYRSQAGDAATRYSPLDQINTGNVKSLQVAWRYHSKDGAGEM